MSVIIKIENLQEMIIENRGQSVLLDSDVARIYKVKTRDINKAVSNNPGKFPEGYLFQLETREAGTGGKFTPVRKTETLNRQSQSLYRKSLVHARHHPESSATTQATLTIIENFSKIRELSRNVKQLAASLDKAQQKTLMQRSGELIAEILDEVLQTSDAKTSIELNFAVL